MGCARRLVADGYLRGCEGGLPRAAVRPTAKHGFRETSTSDALSESSFWSGKSLGTLGRALALAFSRWLVTDGRSSAADLRPLGSPAPFSLAGELSSLRQVFGCALSDRIMGGFFLSNDIDANREARQHFSQLGLPCTDFQLGSYHLTLMQKKHVRGHKNWFQRNDDLIAGVGFWLGDNASGEWALPQVLEHVGQSEHRLGELAGNAAFVFHKGGDVGIVSDRTGHYPLYVLDDGQRVAYSSSLLVLARVARKLTFNRQALQEFVNLETVLGLDTIFEQIRSVPAGRVLTLPRPGVMPSEARRYYRPLETRVPMAELEANLVGVLGRLKTAQFSAGDVCCDLSGGYDSRTVAALLHCAGVEHTLNTNVNSLCPGDHEAAIEAALLTGRPIVVYNLTVPRDEQPSRDSTFWELDMARNLLRGTLTTVSMELKAARHALILGGYGGELFRDVYSRRANVSEVIELDYCRGLVANSYARGDYAARLKDKLQRSLEDLGFGDDVRASERLYLFEKMRTWGGSRISLYNRFTHHWHPLMDHHMQRHILTVGREEKEAAAFQRRIIALDKKLAAAPYLDTAKQSMNSRPRTLLNRLMRIRDLPKRLQRKLKGSGKAYVVPPEYVASLSDFERIAGFTLNGCVSDVHRGRALTLVHAFNQFRDKMG